MLSLSCQGVTYIVNKVVTEAESFRHFNDCDVSVFAQWLVDLFSDAVNVRAWDQLALNEMHGAVFVDYLLGLQLDLFRAHVQNRLKF